jgi:rhomboid protease GluP
VAVETSDKTDRTMTPVTGVLLAANVAAFVAQVAIAGHPRFAFGGGSGADAPTWSTVLRWLGANHSTFTVADNRLETLVTSSFLHGSVLHLAFNMLVLWQVGPFLERAIGRARFLPLYLGAGIMGSAFSAIAGRFFGPSLSVGASGSICGLIGAILVLGARTQGWRGPLTRQMGTWLVVLFLLGFARNVQGGMVQVDNAAHLGGALGGVLLAASWRRGFTYGPRAQAAIVVACTVVFVACGVTVYVRDRTDPYLFMDVDERHSTAIAAFAAGRCEKAVHAIQRARQMDPTSARLRSHAEQIERDCR